MKTYLKRLPMLVLFTLTLPCCTKTWECHEERGDFCVNGVLVEGVSPESRTPEMAARLAHQMDVSLAYWNADLSAMKGWRIKYESILAKDLPCEDSACGGVTINDWMGFGGDSTVYLKIGDSVCLEYSALPHEIGHVVLDGDHNHDDPRWATLGDLVGDEIMQASPLQHCHDLAPYAVRWWDHQLHVP